MTTKLDTTLSVERIRKDLAAVERDLNEPGGMGAHIEAHRYARDVAWLLREIERLRNIK